MNGLRLTPDCPGYPAIGSSLLEPGWLAEIHGDRLAMIVAEGVMMCLPASEVRPFLARIAGHFPGGRMAFDALSVTGARMAGADKALARPDIKDF